jgi:hypothetical protein
VYGDKVQTLLLVVRYYQVVNQQKTQKNKELIKNYSELQTMNKQVVLSDNAFKELLLCVDNVFKTEMKKCHTTFCSITEPIISASALLELVLIYKNTLPDHHMMMKLMGFNSKENQMRNSPPKQTNYYDRLVFFQLLQQACVCNNHHCCYWGIVSAASSYRKAKNFKYVNFFTFWTFVLLF